MYELKLTPDFSPPPQTDPLDPLLIAVVVAAGVAVKAGIGILVAVWLL